MGFGLPLDENFQQAVINLSQLGVQSIALVPSCLAIQASLCAQNQLVVFPTERGAKQN